MSDLELPDLNRAVLDGPTLAALFRDLEACAEILEVRTKGGSTRRTDPRPVGLREAEQLLVQAAVHAVQVTYRYQGELWRDTLMRRADGIHLVRMELGE